MKLSGHHNYHTQLCAFKLGKILVCAEKTLDSFYVLLLRESRKVIEVGESRVQHPIRSQPL